MRVDGAPCMGELHESKSSYKACRWVFLEPKQEIPGYFYMKKITEFDHLHTETGELYREFLKSDCQIKTGELCDVKNIASLAPRLKEYQGQCQTHAGKDTIWMSFRPP